MKKPKKGKGKINNKKCSAGYKSVWLPNAKGVPTSYILPKPKDKPEFKKKEDIANALSAGNDELTVKPSLLKPRAPVHDINSAREAKGLKPITTPADAINRQGKVRAVMEEVAVYARWAKLSADNAWHVSDNEQSARETLEIKMRLSGQVGHWRQEKDQFVGPPIPANDAKVSPSNGYAFANRKPEVRTGLAPSGLPISDFLQGGKYPPKVSDVTPSNNNRTETGLLKYTGSGVADYNWYKNNVNKEYHPDIVSDYENLLDDLSRRTIEWSQAIEDTFEMQEKIERLEAQLRESIAEERPSYLKRELHKAREENEKLKQELWDTKHELSFALWEISVSSGEEVSASDLGKASIKTLANQWNIWKVQLRDNPLHTFCVDKGVSIEQERLLRAHFDYESWLRCKISDERFAFRQMKQARKVNCPNYEYHDKLYEIRQRCNRSVVRARAQRRLAELKQLRESREHPLQASKLDRIARVEFAVRGGYASLFREHLIKETKTYKAIKTVVDTCSKVWNTELNPWEVKRQRIALAEKLAAEADAREQAEADAVAKKVQDEARQRLRKAMSTAY